MKSKKFRSFLVGTSCAVGLLLAVCLLSNGGVANDGSVDSVDDSSSALRSNHVSYAQTADQGPPSLPTSLIHVERRSLKGMMKSKSMMMMMKSSKRVKVSKRSKGFVDPCVPLEVRPTKGKSKGKRQLVETDEATRGLKHRDLKMGKSSGKSKGMMMKKKKKKSGSKGKSSQGKSASVPVSTIKIAESPTVSIMTSQLNEITFCLDSVLL